MRDRRTRKDYCETIAKLVDEKIILEEENKKLQSQLKTMLELWSQVVRHPKGKEDDKEKIKVFGGFTEVK